MGSRTRRLNNPADDSSATACPKCQSLRLWAEIVAEPAIREKGHSLGGVARTIGYSLLAGSDKLYSSWRALVCSECGYTQFYAMKPKDVLPPHDQRGQ